MPEMKPILFNTEMAKAVLDFKKTETRRLIKPQPQNIVPDTKNRKPLAFWVDNTKWVKPPYQPGDILYVPGPWKCSPDSQLWAENEYRVIFKDGEMVQFYFENQERLEKWRKYINKPLENWQSPYFMPREAARIFLRVMDVRVERLQEVYDEFNPHCRECICPYCGRFQTEYCLYGEERCAVCGNKEHCIDCPYYEDV